MLVFQAVYEEMLPTAHLSLPEACFWLSVTNLTTIGYGSIVGSLGTPAPEKSEAIPPDVHSA